MSTLFPPETEPSTSPGGVHAIAALLRESCEPIDGIDSVRLDPLLERIGNARVVLLGEASHGTEEFYRMRSRITRELVERKGFTIVALEADWPDVAKVRRYIGGLAATASSTPAFFRFPTWMWRNTAFGGFVEWLRAWNRESEDADRKVTLAGLDLYSLYESIDAVLAYLQSVDPGIAAIARERYGCLMPWRGEPAAYGQLAVTGRYRSCEAPALEMLNELLSHRLEYLGNDGERFFDAAQNARLIANAERYYRHMYYGSVRSWNLRDTHMFETLQALLDFHGPESRAVVWAHNSHIGDASATELGRMGELNIGELAREHYGDAAYHVGFGTDRGTVAAAHNWDGEMRSMRVRPAHPGSYEWLCAASEVPAFLLALRHPARDAVRDELMPERLERAIGVVYRPATELQSHYFLALLPHQFDEYCWFGETRSVTSLTPVAAAAGFPDTYPFGV